MRTGVDAAAAEHGSSGARPPDPVSRPRLGFVGVGWIGGLRLDAVDAREAAEVAAVCDRDHERLQEVGRRFPGASRHSELETLLDSAGETDLDGVVLATPNALHAPQAMSVLERGLPLFVQKPLGIASSEVQGVIQRARREDRLVEVDFSYRHLEGARRLREIVRSGALGEIHLAEAVFHNAYGPDKSWCFDRRLSGGGALLDLGIHLLDLVFWIFGPSDPERIHSRICELPHCPGIDRFTSADMMLESGLHLRLTCSWNAHAGRDCDVRLVLHGSDGGAVLRNTGGSFYDFELVLRDGRAEEKVVEESRTWMDRGILAWVDRIREDAGFDPSLEANRTVTRVLERIYGDRSAAGGST